MPRLCLAVVLLAVVAGCGSEAPKPDVGQIPEPRDTLTGARAQPPAPPTSGTLTQVPDTRASRQRLGYVNRGLLSGSDLPRAAVLKAVLGRAPAQDAIIRVGDDVLAVDALSRPAPETNAIAPAAQSAAQACLGDTIAQTILGPQTMGSDAAVGVGLAESGDAPAGLQLRICGAPHFLRDLHAMERALHEAFPAKENVIREFEFGEREMVSGTIAAGTVPTARLLDLLAGGRSLRALAWR